MIEYSDAKQYFRYNGFRFLNSKGPYYIVYFSESSNFVKDKNKLNLFYLDFKDIIVRNTSFPRMYLTGELVQNFRENHLIAHKNKKKINIHKNIIYEPNLFFKKVDNKYESETTYRNRKNGKLIYNELKRSFAQVDKNFKKILFYSVDLTTCHKQYNDRKMFLLFKDLKANNLFFDDLLMCLMQNGKTIYKILIQNRKYNYNRVYEYLRYLR